MKRLYLFVFLVLPGLTAAAQDYAPGKLERIYFNPYTDSIKTVVNYYVNVEGVYKGGRVLPLDASTVTLTASRGRMNGNDWIAPKTVDFDRVVFTAVSKDDPALHATITLYLQRWKDPRDDMSRDDAGQAAPPPPRRR